MKKGLLALAAALLGVASWAPPAAAFDCSVDAAACRCVGAIYKDPEASAPGDLSIRVMNWRRAGARLNRRLLDRQLVVLVFSVESLGVHACCWAVDNQGATAAWDNVAVSWLEPDAGEFDQLLFGLYDSTPASGEWWMVTNGDAITAADTPWPPAATANGQEVTVLSGDSRGIPLSKNQTLIGRARDNRMTALRNKIWDEGCPLP